MKYRNESQFSVGKKMAAAHFTTAWANLAQPIRHKDSHGNICPCTNNSAHVQFEGFITFPYVIMSTFSVTCASNYGYICQSPSFEDSFQERKEK